MLIDEYKVRFSVWPVYLCNKAWMLMFMKLTITVTYDFKFFLLFSLQNTTDFKVLFLEFDKNKILLRRDIWEECVNVFTKFVCVRVCICNGCSDQCKTRIPVNCRMWYWFVHYRNERPTGMKTRRKKKDRKPLKPALIYTCSSSRLFFFFFSLCLSFVIIHLWSCPFILYCFVNNKSRWA